MVTVKETTMEDGESSATVEETTMEDGESLANKSCYECREKSHFKKNCPWLHITCFKCKKGEMKLWWCRQGQNAGRGFLRCQTQPYCDAFEWMDNFQKKQLEAELESIKKDVK